MMKYGEYSFMVERDSVTITNKQRVILRHYIDTNRSDQEHLGREATIITCSILSRNESELIQIEQLLHSDQSRDLEWRGRVYKLVKPDGDFSSHPVDYVNAKWITDARFIALDPVPYSVVTGEAIY